MIKRLLLKFYSEEEAVRVCEAVHFKSNLNSHITALITPALNGVNFAEWR